MQRLHLQDNEKNTTLKDISDIPVPGRSINELNVGIELSSAAAIVRKSGKYGIGLTDSQYQYDDYATASNDGVGHKMKWLFSFI